MKLDNNNKINDFQNAIYRFSTRQKLILALNQERTPIYTPEINTHFVPMSSKEVDDQKLSNALLKNNVHQHHLHNTHNQQNHNYDIFLKSSAAPGVVCPDQKSTCPPETTCCALSKNVNIDESVVYVVYGCCPIENAVCCDDHLHCCPSKTKCDLRAEICISPNVSFLKYLNF